MKNIKSKKKPLFQFGETDPEMRIIKIDDLDDISDGDFVCFIHQSTGTPTTLKICEYLNQKFKCRITLIEGTDGEMRSIGRGRITKNEISDSMMFKINVKESLIGFFKYLCPAR